MRRHLFLLLLPVVVVGSLAGCSAATDPVAARVGDTTISAASLRADLAAIGRDPTYQGLLEESYGASLDGDGEGNYDSSFVARVLSLRVFYELLEQAVAEGDLTPTEEDLEAAEEVVRGQFASIEATEVLDDFPRAYRDRLIRQQALVVAAERLVLGDPEAYFRDNPELFQLACSSHILVSTQTASDEEALAEADDLAEQLADGADFAELAAEHSDDQGSAADGGDLGCELPGVYLEAFGAALTTATIGKVTDPVRTEAGYHLILVTERRPATYAEVSDVIPSLQAAASDASLDRFLGELSCDEGTEISVDRRYGSWDRSGCDDPAVGVAFVAPPTRGG